MFGPRTIEELDRRYGRVGLSLPVQLVQDWTQSPDGPVVIFGGGRFEDGILTFTDRHTRTRLTREHTLSWSASHSDAVPDSDDTYKPDTWDKTVDTWFEKETGTFTVTNKSTLFWTDKETFSESFTWDWTATAWIDYQWTVTQVVTSWNTDAGGNVGTGSEYVLTIWETFGTEFDWASWDTWSANTIPQNALTDVSMFVPVTFIEQWSTAITLQDPFFTPVTTFTLTEATTEWWTNTLTHTSTLYTDFERETWTENRNGETWGRAWTTQVGSLPDYEGDQAITKFTNYDNTQGDNWETIWSIPEVI